MKERIKTLESQLKTSEEERLRYEQNMNIEEKQMKQKFSNYERNFEQLTLMY